MRKVTLAVGLFAIFLAGCSMQQPAVNRNHKTETVQDHSKSSHYYQAVLAAQKKGSEQRQTLAAVTKQYIGRTDSDASSNRDSVMVYPGKVKAYTGRVRGYKGIVVSGVVTNWHSHARSANHEVLTEYELLVNRQLTFRAKQNLEGTTIKVLHLGGYTTIGDQMDGVPDKPQVAAAESEKVVFTEHISSPLPRIGDQIFIALVPNDRQANLNFHNQNRFSKTDIFSLAAGDTCYFFFNKQTKQYEARIADPETGQLKATNLNSGEDDAYQKARRGMLADVNRHYRTTAISK
ncbi:hypothetical protein ACNAN0_01830 [Agrilactobacillus fermenti]|uniref:hypothetical protein n=1 Tax=Agrilactobacillus fermenti TaxID=2586909 RepID=UPI003A5BA686